MNREAARALATGNWSIFPTKNKQPLTPNGFKDATIDVAVVDGWWTENPDAQVAIAIPLGMIVVDVDTPDATHPHDGFASLASLETLHGPLPPTLTSVSGRGGEHRWFRVPDSTVLTQRKIAPGIDTRIGGKGYVVAPPSMHHESGKPYRWADPNQAVADAPAWVVAALSETKTEAPAAAWPTPTSDALVTARSWLANAAPSIQGQDGSGSLMKAAGVLVRGFALGPGIATELLREYNARAVPPWDDAALTRAAASAARSSREPALGSMLPDVDLLGAVRAGAQPRPTALEILEIGDIFMNIPNVDYLIQGLGVAPGAPAMIAGYGYSGKTVAVQQLVIDMTCANPVGDWMNPRPVWGKFHGGKRARVLHIDYEQGRTLTCRRYQRLAQAAGLTKEDFRGFLSLVSLPQFYLNTAAGYAMLERLCENVDLLVIDSFRAANPGLEENSSDAREPLDALNRISEKHGCSSLVIHHARKPSNDRPGGPKMSIRGSGALFDGCASVLIFEGEKDQPKRVTHEKERHCGITVDDFDLVVEDVEGGGFRVRASDVTKLSAKDRGNEELQADMAEMRAWLKEHLFFKNLAQIAKCLGIRKERASAAMGALETSGELVSSGSSQTRAYHLSGTVPTTGR